MAKVQKTITPARKPVTAKQTITEAKTGRHTPIEQKTQVSRAIGNGAGTKRGNRRDMHPVFSTGKTKSAGGKPGPSGRSTRKGGPDSAATSA